jgi:hypothetical protein
MADTASRGAAAVEFAISLPFLAVMIIGVLDIGRALTQYLLLTEAVHQGVRYGGQLELLDPGNTNPEHIYSGLSAGQNCAAVAPGGGYELIRGHRAVQNRVIQILNLNRIALKANGLCVYTRVRDAGSIFNRNIRVQIGAQYSSFFPLFDGLQINVQATGPYLITARPLGGGLSAP